MAIFKFEELLKKHNIPAQEVTSSAPSVPKKQGFFRDAMSDIRQVGTGIKNSYNRRQDNITTSMNADQGFASRNFQKTGEGFGFVSDVSAEVIKGGVKAVLPQGGEDFVKASIPKVIDGMAKFGKIITPDQVTDFGAELFLWYDGLDEETKRNANASFNIVSLLSEAFGVGVGAKGVKVAGRATTRMAGEAFEQVGESLAGAIKAGKESTGGVLDVVRPAMEAVINAPARIKTNLEAVKLSEQAIQKLPSPAQKAVRQGVDIEDVATTLNVKQAQKPALAKLYSVVKDFVGDNTKRNPIEVVGKPVADKFNTLKVQTTKLGNELDDIAENLSGKQVKGGSAIVSTVDESLAKLRIGKTVDGQLDFKGSNLEGLGTDEKIVNNIYRRLKDSNDANDLHRLKRYIDNNVSFGKTSDGFTGEAENLIKNWRRVIDGTLDAEFPAYNNVNTELAKRLKPINDFKKHMKTATGLDEDLMNMSAGQLMRRIASNVRSNPELRQVLRDLDNATSIKGKVSLDTESLVNFYAVLEKYYPEIVGKNTFQGQIKNALGGSGSLLDRATDVVKKFAGQSEAVKRKAITDFFDDFFQSGKVTKPVSGVPNSKKGMFQTAKDNLNNPRSSQGGFIKNPLAKGPPKPTTKSLSSANSNISAKEAVAKGLTEEQFVKANTKEFSYQGGHQPNPDGVRSFDLTEMVDGEQMIPKDMYSRWYGSNGTPADLQSISVLKKIKGNPEADVTIYRASPSKDFNNGDWVALSKKYADEHAIRNKEAGKSMQVYSKVVKAKELRWAMDDVNEFGFYPSDVKTTSQLRADYQAALKAKKN